MTVEVLVLLAVAPAYFALGIASIVWVHWTELRSRHPPHVFADRRRSRVLTARGSVHRPHGERGTTG